MAKRRRLEAAAGIGDTPAPPKPRIPLDTCSGCGAERPDTRLAYVISALNHDPRAKFCVDARCEDPKVAERRRVAPASSGAIVEATLP